jgi:hypothetical protein
MSIQTTQNTISRLNKEIVILEILLAAEVKNELNKSKQLNQLDMSITKNTSLSTLRSKQSQMIRIQDEISRIVTKKASISKKISEKIEQLTRSQQQLVREQTTELKRKEQADKIRRQDELRHQQKISQELQKQRSISKEIDHGIYDPIKKEYDFFISHASEDKEDFVRLLAQKLKEQGLNIWYDEFELKVGDSLRRSIDNGLKNSRYGIVVLSTSFFNKNWPQYELDGLVTREMNGIKVILPIWHKVSKDEVLKYSPSLADKVALNSSLHSIDEIVAELRKFIAD